MDVVRECGFKRCLFLCKNVSWRPDPDAMAVDVFTLDWSKFRAFCFPSFSLISRVLQTLDLSGRVCDCGAF